MIIAETRAEPLLSVALWYASTVPMSRKNSCNQHGPGPADQPRQQIVADVTRRAVDLVEHVRVKGVHAGVDQVRHRLGLRFSVNSGDLRRSA